MSNVLPSPPYIFPSWRSDGFELLLTRLTNLQYPIAVANGVFDIPSAAHVEVFRAARRAVTKPGEHGVVIVAMNSDASTQRLKGPKRPYLPWEERAAIVAAMRDVDVVVGFNEATPACLLRLLKPEFLVKGAEYEGRYLPGKGKSEVRLVPMLDDTHTTDLVARILEREGPNWSLR